MDARHCAGSEMSDLMSMEHLSDLKRLLERWCKGFIGCAADATSHYFGKKGYWLNATCTWLCWFNY